MSPRAAARLETLGFSQVYDYVAGKADWFASGLPIEGMRATLRRAGDLAGRDVPHCRLNDRVSEVRDRVHAAGWDDACVVLNEEQQVVLGLVRWDDVDRGPLANIEAAMEAGPTTFRPNVLPGQPLAYLRRHGLSSVLVTTSSGRLIGLLRRADVERVAGSEQA